MKLIIKIGKNICDRYFVEGGKAPEARFRSSPMQIVRKHDGERIFTQSEGINEN